MFGQEGNSFLQKLYDLSPGTLFYFVYFSNDQIEKPFRLVNYVVVGDLCFSQSDTAIRIVTMTFKPYRSRRRLYDLSFVNGRYGI